MYDISSRQLVELDVKWRTRCPHVVVLGAGASLAAFPHGDRTGRRLPLIADFIEVVGLRKLISAAGHDPTENFETLYSRLHTLGTHDALLRKIERRVENYFGALELPPYPTLYDLLLLSLREKDAIFTFNWDPFLCAAYARQAEDDVPLPQIFHLHGNVGVSFCRKCRLAMPKAAKCRECDGRSVRSRLLYPIEKKNYANDPFIKTQWDRAREFIRRAMIITIFGYSAPKTDREAMAIFTGAWKHEGATKLIKLVEVIDVRDKEELARQWSQFSFFQHYDIRHGFHESLLAHYPRRSCEARAHAGVNGEYVESIPWAANLVGARKSVEAMIAAERARLA